MFLHVFRLNSGTTNKYFLVVTMVSILVIVGAILDLPN